WRGRCRRSPRCGGGRMRRGRGFWGRSGWAVCSARSCLWPRRSGGSPAGAWSAPRRVCGSRVRRRRWRRRWGCRWWGGGAAGAWFLGLFGVGYVLITQFPVPRTILTLSSGVLFGPWVGVLVALSATTVAAALSLSVVRGLLGEWMAPRLRHPAVAGINAR